MSRIQLAEPDQLSGYLRELHENAAEADWSTRHVARAFAAAPELLEQYLTGFYYNWHSNEGSAAPRLSPREKELIRLRIATLNGCETCRAARLAPRSVSEADIRAVDGAAQNTALTPREQAAVEFAESMAQHHFAIDDDTIAALRQHFDDAELLELLMMTGQYIGFGRVLAVLQLETTTCSIAT